MNATMSGYAPTQGETLDQYLDAMFGYYEEEEKEVVKGVGAPSNIARYRSTFEAIITKFGLDLADLSFNEIIQGNYYQVLKVRGLIDHANNESYISLGGII